MVDGAANLRLLHRTQVQLGLQTYATESQLIRGQAAACHCHKSCRGKNLRRSKLFANEVTMHAQ